MTTTRRDLLAAVMVAPLAMALSTTVSAGEPIPSQPPVYLRGYTAFQDYTEQPDLRQMLGGEYEMYADDRKAIFRVLLRGEGGSMSWLERVYVQPEQIAMMRELCAMLKEATP